MKLPAGMAPGAGIAAGGRRLAVRLRVSVQFAEDPGDDAGTRVCVASAARVSRCAWSRPDPHPAKNATIVNPRAIRASAGFIDTPGVAGGGRSQRARRPVAPPPQLRW